MCNIITAMSAIARYLAIYPSLSEGEKNVLLVSLILFAVFDQPVSLAGVS